MLALPVLSAATPALSAHHEAAAAEIVSVQFQPVDDLSQELSVVVGSDDAQEIQWVEVLFEDLADRPAPSGIEMLLQPTGELDGQRVFTSGPIYFESAPAGFSYPILVSLIDQDGLVTVAELHDVAVPAALEQTLDSHDGDLHVAAGETITVLGAVTGQVTVEGTLHVAAGAVVDGDVEVWEGGSVSVDGHLKGTFTTVGVHDHGVPVLISSWGAVLDRVVWIGGGASIDLVGATLAEDLIAEGGGDVTLGDGVVVAGSVDLLLAGDLFVQGAVTTDGDFTARPWARAGRGEGNSGQLEGEIGDTTSCPASSSAER